MIYIALPVHDERHTVGLLMWRVRELLMELERDFEILVVDDGSTDGTAEILEPYRRVLPLTVITHEKRLGYAAALERLVREAVLRSSYPKRDAFISLQADFTSPPEAIPEMLRRFEGGVDLVTVSDPSRSGRPRSVGFARRGAPFVTRSLQTPGEIDDPFEGFRLYRLFVLKRALERVTDGRLLRHGGWAANAELLLAVWPHVRQMDQLQIQKDYSRRYRDSRFRWVPELLGLYRASRDRRLRGPRLSREEGS